MPKKTIIFCLFCVLILPAFQQNATASIGIRWTFYNAEILPDSFSGTSPNHQTGAYIGSFVSNGEFIYFGARYYSFSSKNETSATIFQPFIGLRYYPRRASASGASAYLTAEVFKSYVKLKSKEGNYSNADLEYLKKPYSLSGFSFGIGGSYNISADFAFGAEFGLRWFYSKAKASSESSFYPGNKDYLERRLYTLIYIDFAW